jgi:hypothetical protein
MAVADRRKAFIVIGGSILVTGALVATVLSLGSWAYHTRRFLLHQRRLAPLQEKHATGAEISAALLAESGVHGIAVPPTKDELVAMVGQWRGGRDQDVVSKLRAARSVRIFAVEDMVYVLLFDPEDRLQSYALLSN